MAYELRERVPTPERYVELREAVGMNPRSLEAARRGLPNTMYGVTVVETDSGGDGRDGPDRRRRGYRLPHL